MHRNCGLGGGRPACNGGIHVSIAYYHEKYMGVVENPFEAHLRHTYVEENKVPYDDGRGRTLERHLTDVAPQIRLASVCLSA